MLWMCHLFIGTVRHRIFQCQLFIGTVSENGLLTVPSPLKHWIRQSSGHRTSLQTEYDLFTDTEPGVFQSWFLMLKDTPRWHLCSLWGHKTPENIERELLEKMSSKLIAHLDLHLHMLIYSFTHTMTLYNFT